MKIYFQKRLIIFKIFVNYIIQKLLCIRYIFVGYIIVGCPDQGNYVKHSGINSVLFQCNCHKTALYYWSGASVLPKFLSATQEIRQNNKLTSCLTKILEYLSYPTSKNAKMFERALAK